MISSEVQRTLVKSPPELWTELSDPQALARHLGELGEIRITRTEPENLVEWEAEGTTGTVEIAPSGWGTRVTLTVLRELAVEEAKQAEPEKRGEIPAESEEPAEPQAGDHTPAESEEPAEPQPGVLTAEHLQAETDSHAAAELGAGSDAATGATAGVEAQDPATPGAERKPAPATEAARRAAGWPGARHAPGPAIESDLRAAEALDGPPPEPDGLHDWAAQSAEAEDAELREDSTPEDQRPAEPAPPKRGLFARLFGRRRGRAKAPAPLEELCSEGVEGTDAADAMPLAEEPAVEPRAEPDAPETPLAVEPRAEPDAPETPLAVEPHGEQGDPDTPRAGGAQEQVAWEALAGADGDPAEPAGQESELELAAAAPDASRPPVAAAQGPEIFPGEPLQDAEQTVTAAPENAATQPVQTAEAAEAATPAADIAAELRAAEEVASEQVEAVLSAVLDRLGSAHHRPFSRP